MTYTCNVANNFGISEGASATPNFSMYVSKACYFQRFCCDLQPHYGNHPFILRPRFLQFLEIWFEKSGSKNLVRKIWFEKSGSRKVVDKKKGGFIP